MVPVDPLGDDFRLRCLILLANARGWTATRENEVMTIATTDRPLASDWHAERLKIWWNRLRAWDGDHQLWSDTGVVIVLLVACLTFPGGFVEHGRKEFLLQIALIVPLIWRRRAPTLVFSIIAGVALVQWLTSVPLPADVALLVALFTLAVHASPRRALLGSVVVLAGVVMASVRWSPGGDIVKSVVFLTGLLVASLFTGIALRTWRSYMDSLVERTRRLEHESEQQAMLAAAAERSRIAREMHDVIAHSVSIMVTLADGALATVDGHPAKAKEAMADVSATGRLALTDMRHLLGVLRSDESVPSTVSHNPSSPACLGSSRASAPPDSMSSSTRRATPFDIPPGVRTHRLPDRAGVADQCAETRREAVERPTSRSPSMLLSSMCNVRDDGASPGARVGEGHGLGGMRERAAFSGGLLIAGPRRKVGGR